MVQILLVRNSGEEEYHNFPGSSCVRDVLDQVKEPDLYISQTPRPLSLLSFGLDTKLETILHFSRTSPIELTAYMPHHSHKRTKNEEVVDLSQESEEEESTISPPPLFYQNPIPELGVPDSEQFCTRALWDFIEKPHLVKEAYLLTYVVDLDVVAKHFPPALFTIPVTLVSGVEVSEATFRSTFLHEFSRRMTPKLPSPFGKYHTKMMLLFYDTGLRVVVHTSNLEATNLFWHAEGAWCQDFPEINETTTTTPRHKGEFEEHLVRILLSSGISEADTTVGSRFDFSSAEVALVSTIPRATAYTSTHDVKQFGLGRIRDLLEREAQLNPEWGRTVSSHGAIVLQCSSLGTMNSHVGSHWLFDELGKALGAVHSDQLNLVVVSESFVHQNNFVGPEAGLATFYKSEHFDSKAMRKILCTWTPSNPLLPTRSLVVPHIKTFLCVNKENQDIAWLLLGSHNCSKAAWGYWTKTNKLVCLSHEVSVLFLPSLMRLAGNRRWNAASGCWTRLRGGVHSENALFTSQHPQQHGSRFFPIPYALPVSRYDYSREKPFVSF